MLRNFPNIEQLVTRINEGLAQGTARNEAEKALYRKVASHTKEQQQALQEFYRQGFDCGMYMRRWEGPGNPYPIQEGVTQRHFSPDANVSAALQRMQSQYDAFPASLKECVHEMMIVQWRSPEADVTNEPFFRSLPRGAPAREEGLFQKVKRGEYCIRMASSRFIWTSAYYLRLCFGEMIPNFIPHELAVIT